MDGTKNNPNLWYSISNSVKMVDSSVLNIEFAKFQVTNIPLSPSISSCQPTLSHTSSHLHPQHSVSFPFPFNHSIYASPTYSSHWITIATACHLSSPTVVPSVTTTAFSSPLCLSFLSYHIPESASFCFHLPASVTISILPSPICQPTFPYLPTCQPTSYFLLALASLLPLHLFIPAISPLLFQCQGRVPTQIVNCYRFPPGMLAEPPSSSSSFPVFDTDSRISGLLHCPKILLNNITRRKQFSIRENKILWNPVHPRS